TVSLQYLSTPGQVDIRIWTDKFGLLCDSNLSGSAEYPEPAGETTLDLPFGQMGLDAVIEGVDVRATQNLMVQVSPSVAATAPSPAGDVDAYGPFVARVLYDSTLFNSGVTFTCIPPKGKSSCTP
ncbi:MAG TPA: hypothetical protein VHN37_11175, partial [Actinomycetota bacterium]|nr:hypothetical protein [Actinomycetota bacterium]